MLHNLAARLALFSAHWRFAIPIIEISRRPREGWRSLFFLASLHAFALIQTETAD